MWCILVVVFDPRGDTFQNSLGIGAKVAADVITFKGFDKGLCHAIAFWATHGCKAA